MSIEHSPARQKPARVCLTVKEFSEATAISKATLYRVMSDGRLKFVKIGRATRIPTEEQVRLGLASNV